MKTLLAAILIFAFAWFASAKEEADQLRAKETYSHVLKVRNFFGAEGYGYEYFLGKDTLVVVLSDDFGSPRKEVFSKRLTKEEASAWERYLKDFPMKNLKADYTDARVSDGMQRHFTFKTADGEKEIAVRNVEVKELMELCKKLNELLPEKFRMSVEVAAAAGPPVK